MNKKNRLRKEVLLYALIGGGSSALDTCCYILLTRYIGIKEIVSNFISVNIGITCSFLLNAYCNFKKTDKIRKRALSFFTVGYLGMLLSSLILYIGTTQFLIDDIVVKIASIGIVAIFQFCLNRLITFSRI